MRPRNIIRPHPLIGWMTEREAAMAWRRLAWICALGFAIGVVLGFATITIYFHVR